MKKILLKIYFWFFAVLAKFYLLRNNPSIIWITWSIWKTSCRMVIYDVLKKHLDDKVIYTSSKNFNWELWLSLSVLWIESYTPTFKWVCKVILEALKISFFWKKEYDILLLEYWIDHIWEMNFLLKIVKPHYSVVTKIDKVHSSQFQSKEITAKEKYLLSKNTKNIAFLNDDDGFSSIYKNSIKAKTQTYTTNYDSQENNLELIAKDFEIIKENNIPYSKFKVINNNSEINIKSNLIWKENIWYTNIWYSILEELFKKYYKKSFFENNQNDISIDFEFQPWRFSTFLWINDSILIDWTYNAAPFSMQKFIENWESLKKYIYPNYKTIYCLWDMRELGDYTKEEHEKLANFILDKADFVFLVWDSSIKYMVPELIKKWFPEDRIRHFENSKILWENLLDFIKKINKKFVIFFKWSQNTIFLEESVKQVLEKKEDIKNICRQEDYWLDKKNKFFNN